MTLSKDYRLGARVVEAVGNGDEAARESEPDGPSLRFQARVNNVLNHTQPRRYGSVVTSPLFGLPTGYTSGRTVTLSTSLEF